MIKHTALDAFVWRTYDG